MTTQTKVKFLNMFDWVVRAASLLSLIFISYGSLYVYKHDAEFEAELDKKYVNKETAKYFYDSRDVELTTRDVTDQFKTKTNTAIANIKSEADVHEATIVGILTRIERDMRETRQDVKELYRRDFGSTSHVPQIDDWANDEEWIAEND